MSMRILGVLAVAAIFAAGPAVADYRSHGGNHSPPRAWHGDQRDGGYRYHDNSGATVGGALLGLGAGALLGGALRPPAMVYAPRPYPYYYTQPPVVYSPPRVYYGQ
jgi:hypothetical protein